MLLGIDPMERTAETIPSASFPHFPCHERRDIQGWTLHTPYLLGDDLAVESSVLIPLPEPLRPLFLRMREQLVGEPHVNET